MDLDMAMDEVATAPESIRQMISGDWPNPAGLGIQPIGSKARNTIAASATATAAQWNRCCMVSPPRVARFLPEVKQPYWRASAGPSGGSSFGCRPGSTPPAGHALKQSHCGRRPDVRGNSHVKTAPWYRQAPEPDRRDHRSAGADRGNFRPACAAGRARNSSGGGRSAAVAPGSRPCGQRDFSR